jgi:hypothetical protein
VSLVSSVFLALIIVANLTSHVPSIFFQAK